MMAYLPEIERVTVDELKKGLDSGGDLLIVDVRNPTDYGASKVKLPGAVRVAFSNFENDSATLDASKDVITYCT